jgi:opacity protein-like surface antigen
MKKLTLSLLTACAVATPAFAGVTVVTSKEYKQPVALPPPCFRDQEFALDLFYSFNNGHRDGHDHDNGSHTHERYRDGSGGGVALTYFFARYFGISVEGNWWDGYETHHHRTTTHKSTHKEWDYYEDDYVKRTKTKKRHHKESNRSVAHQVTANFIIRYPLEFSNICLAPYIFGGGGGLFDGEKVGFGDAGAGLEWRATENFGIFADWRWVFTGKGKNDIDQTRAGVRFVF